ncbi:MAG: FtsW/RodA/SpoVE family cell cycle protein [Oligoflexia bacterium]|nr:FtsW/RodA/SpoVE family cell cycle protein [Oligoflexia bacterium]
MATITKTLSANYKRLDRSLLLTAFSLMGIGLVLVYSASFIFATENYDDGLYFFRRQIVFVAISLLVMWFASRVSVSLIKKSFWFLYGLSILLLMATFIPGISHSAGGAARWIDLPLGFHIEPGEITKMMSALIFTWLLTREKPAKEPWYKGILLSIVLVGLPVLLLLQQPDFGSSVLFFLIGLTLLFCFGLPWGYLIAAFITAIPLFIFL